MQKNSLNTKKKKKPKRVNSVSRKVIIDKITGPHGISREDFFLTPLFFMPRSARSNPLSFIIPENDLSTRTVLYGK
jgi:hypothetical protein